jgi:hypothetical protein
MAQCRIDGEAFSACDSPKSYTGLADGPHKFEARATDAHGNVEATPARVSFTVDTAPADTPPADTPPAAPLPETMIGRSPRNPKRARTHFRFHSSIAGSSFTCQLDDQRPKPCVSPQAYRDLDPGHHVFSVAATSPAGKTDPTPATARFRISRAP